MTQHFDEAQARERLQREHERVHGLIDNLKSEGLDAKAVEAMASDIPAALFD